MSRTRERLADLGLRPSRRRGQCFLVDPGIARRIVEAAGIDGASVLEIGPGLGALTAFLAERAASLTLVEVEAALAAELVDRYADQPSVRVVAADALEVDYAELLGEGPWTVVANLPYSVGTPILRRLVETRGLFSRIVVMLQLEVADRLAAEAGTKSYGALTLHVGLRGRVRRLMKVPPGAFQPRPRVDSAVVAIDLADEPRAAVADEASFHRVVRAAFAQRRKTLRRALSGVLDSSQIEAADIDPGRRGETLSLDEFARLANAATCA